MTLRRLSILAAVSGAFALAADLPAWALVPYRVADVNPTFMSAGSRPEDFVRVGSRALFLAHTPGLGLWSSDGTPAGTVRLARNQVSIDFLEATGDLLFFISCDAQRCRLLATDGTVAGTRAVATPFVPSLLASVSAGPRRIFFVRETPALGHELWTSDGTPVGTRLVKDVIPGPVGSLPEHLVWFRDRLWFFVQNALWTSDGKASGTRRIAEVGRALQVGTAGTRLLFSTFVTGGTGARLWSSDGSAAGTRVLPGVSPPTGTPGPLASTGTDVYFFAFRQGPSGSVADLWASDGTPGKTRKVATFDGDGVQSFFLVAGTRVAFAVRDEERSELWTSDGRAAGTRSLETCPGEGEGLSSFSDTSTISDGRRIWFACKQGFVDDALWVSDLTPAGTRRVKEFDSDGSRADPRFFQAGNGRVYFLAGRFSDTQLWTSDGTAAGTRSLTPRFDDETSEDVGTGAVVGERAIFRFKDAAHGAEPWVTNGTLAGTTLVADLEKSQDGGSFPFSLGAGVGRCFFVANRVSSGRETELWSSDGGAAGTALVRRFSEFEFSSGAFVADLGARAALIDSFHQLWISDGTANGTFRATSDDLRLSRRARALGGRLFFEAHDDAHGNELWTTDGTPAGTLRLSDFENSQPFVSDSFEPQIFRLLGDRVVFLAADPLGRFEPWVSDGTIGGTRHLAEVYPALVASFFELSSEIVPVGGKYFYVSGEESEVGTEPALWVTDLTVAGTRKVGALVDSQGNPAGETGLFALGGKLILFYGTTFELGFWTSDGTGLLLGAVGIGLGSAQPRAITPSILNGRLVFLAQDGRLYTTDGTAAGTVKIVGADGQDIRRPSAFAVLGNRVAFSNPDGIWDADGSPAGTVRRLASRTGVTLFDFVRVGERIFFPWYDATTGTELWALRP